MTGWRKRTIMEMAREAQLPYFYQTGETANLPQLEAFAALVRADERNRTWTQEHWTEYEHSIAAQERESCAKVCDHMAVRYEDMRGAALESAAESIRLRGQV